MIIFDTLIKLENYSRIIPHMSSIINTMDHSKPYDDEVGEYIIDDDTKYIVSAHLSSPGGFFSEEQKGRLVLEICLEGDELVNVDGSVFHLSPGTFLLYQGESVVKRGLSYLDTVAFKTVRFIL